MAFRQSRRAFRCIFARFIPVPKNQIPFPKTKSRSQKPNPVPNSSPRPRNSFPTRSQRMPLQSLTQWRRLKPEKSQKSRNPSILEFRRDATGVTSLQHPTNKALPCHIFVSPFQGSPLNSSIPHTLSSSTPHS